MISKGWRVLRRAATIWIKNQLTASAAAIAFYAVLSMAPTLVFATAAATRWLGEEASREEVIERLDQFAGPESADLARSVLRSEWYLGFSQQPLTAAAPTTALLLLGSSAVFVQLRRTLQRVFDASRDPDRSLLASWFFGRIIAAGFAAAGGLLFVTSIIGSTVVLWVGEWFSKTFHTPESVWRFGVPPTTFLLVFVMLLTTYRYLPSKRPPWGNLIVGALVSALAFELGRWTLSAYLSTSLIASAYGPASSVVAFLLWTYYSALILIFGAVLAQALCLESGETGL